MTELQGLPLLYAVWVPGEGWLKARDHVFADHRREVADSAAGFIAGARVCVIDDDAMRALESRFLNEEAKALRPPAEPGRLGRIQALLGQWKAALRPKG